MTYDTGASGLRRRLPASVAAVLVVTAGGALVSPQHAAAARANQPLAKLLVAHPARRAPSLHAAVVATVAARRPLTGVRTVLPQYGRATDHAGRVWLHVALPGRPNSSTGWIRAYRTRQTSTPWRITVALGARRVKVFYDGRVVRRYSAVVGKPSTPTPRGRFFIEESESLGSQAGGPFALASSARSDVLQDFDGGPGQIALHGRNGLGGTLGTAASHGCIRLDTRAITWLSARIGAGVPLTISR